MDTNKMRDELNRKTVLAQRLREYMGNPHHTNPPSAAFLDLVEEIAAVLTNSVLTSTDEVLSQAYWDFDARRKGYPPYKVPAGQECAAFKVAVISAIEAQGLKVAP